MNTKTALITGASSGIGLALAKQFARNGYDLVLTATKNNALKRIALNLSKQHGVKAGILDKDLTNENAPQEIFDALKLSNTIVDVLVNDAGMGQRGKFAETPLEKDVATIRLNIEAVVRLTKLFLATKTGGLPGRILNVASVAGFEPGPLLAVYHASKAFVLSFSEALAVELEDTNVSVTALCPGATHTDFFRKADMTQTKIFQKGRLMNPDEVAEAGYNALMKGDRICIPGPQNKALVFIRRLTSVPLQAKINKRFYENVDVASSRRSTRRQKGS